MTDKEIIKALECCSKNPLNCRKCGYKGRCNRIDCYDYLKRDAFDLINRQQAEIERLKIENQSLRAAANSYKIHYDKARTEAVKEFAEKLKSSIYINTNLLVYQCEEVESVVDDIVKEWLGDDE